MRKIIDLSTSDCNKIINEFYHYFETGYKFEEFLKIYLEKIGLEEVSVTRRSGDGGIDLTAVRKGVGGLSNAMDELFYVQAKRYDPSRLVPPEKIRALRGSFSSGTGIFITTGKVSANAKLDAQQVDPSRPIIVIDGKELVSTCIDKEIGFTFKPVFSKTALDSIMEHTFSSSAPAQLLTTVERNVTENDVRAHILVLPRAIKDILAEDAQMITVRFGDLPYKEHRIDARRRYISRVTQIYRDFGLKQADGAFIPKKAVWHIEDNGKFSVDFKEIQ